MRRQYRRKASEVHPPVAATISGGTPARRSSTAPPLCGSYGLGRVSVQRWPRCRRRFMAKELAALHPGLSKR